MNSPDPMSREELMELAALDALGLLEAYESSLFTRLFHHAPESLRAELLALQAEVASDPTLLPGVEPDPSLRERVLAAVLRHSADVMALEPLAMVPPAGVGTARASKGTVIASTETRRTIMGGGGLWRAASFLLIGALLVSIFFNLRFLERIEAISETALGMRNDLVFERLVGRDVWSIAGHPGTARIAMVAGPDAAFPCAGFVLIDEQAKSVQFLAIGLSSDESYLITVFDDAGELLSQHIAPPPVKGFVCAVKLNIDSSQATRLLAAKIEVRSLDGGLLLTTA